jgi:hypothetical protein
VFGDVAEELYNLPNRRLRERKIKPESPGLLHGERHMVGSDG